MKWSKKKKSKYDMSKKVFWKFSFASTNSTRWNIESHKINSYVEVLAQEIFT